MSLNVDIDYVPSLPDNIPDNFNVPRAADAIERINEENAKYEYAKSWNMKPIIENYKKIVLYKIFQFLETVNKSSVTIPMHDIVKSTWLEYMDENLDKYQLSAICNYYCISDSSDYLYTRFFNDELRSIVEEYLQAGGWKYEIPDYYKYNTEVSKIYLRFTDEMLGDVNVNNC